MGRSFQIAKGSYLVQQMRAYLEHSVKECDKLRNLQNTTVYVLIYSVG